MRDELRTCQNCKQEFIIAASDFLFYEKMGVPPPEACPACRKKRRLCFKNDWNYYPNSCKKCGKQVVSIYAPHSERTVYCPACWWGDSWNPLSYGRDFDFTKTFTEQFAELLKVVPRAAMLNSESENCEYTQFAANNKNCYMLVQSSNNEEVYYSYWSQKCKDSIDTSFMLSSELCYDSVGLENCYRTRYSATSSGCVDSYFLTNCDSCTNCFGSVNLRNKKYCVFNEQKTQAEYETYIESLHLDTWEGVERAREQYRAFLLTQPMKYAGVHSIENCTGDWLHRAKNCFRVFDGYDIEEVRYGEHILRNVKDCMDSDCVARDCELVYEGVQNVINIYNCKFCFVVRQGSSNLEYCDHAVGSNECFGCVSIKKNEFCILNKQYSKQEYEDLKKKIIEHMRKTGEYGKFFDPKLSSFGYNLTNAHEQFPLTKDEALKQGFLWEDTPPGTYGKETVQWDASADQIPDESVTKQTFACASCRRNYRIVSQELSFYRREHLPLPRKCPTCRFEARSALRNPANLWSRRCMCKIVAHGHGQECPTQFETPYSENRPEIVYCESCYQAEVV